MKSPKRTIATACVAVGVLLVVIPLVFEVVFGIKTYNMLRSVGVQAFDGSFLLFASSACFCIAAVLQFPFREEEGWECDCGYDLSFISKASGCCPECGNKVQLEWSDKLGTFPRKTTIRVRKAILYFTLSLGMLFFGISTRIF